MLSVILSDYNYHSKKTVSFFSLLDNLCSFNVNLSLLELKYEMNFKDSKFHEAVIVNFAG